MTASEPSPVSDESSSEGLHPHALVNETIVHDLPTAMSPRSALLAHTSLREHSVAEPVNNIIEPSRTRKRISASERRRKRERDLANASPSQRELVSLLIDQELEASILRKQLYVANQRVASEARRAAELEQANQLATQRYREINESRVVVQQEASKAIQDSRIHHLELENAQKEIQRARESLKHIEKERDDAEAAAARARAKTRKLREQQMVAAAHEEGRRLGFEVGFEHARQERLSVPRRRPRTRQSPRSSSGHVVTKPHSPANNASYQRSPRSPNSQEEDEEVMQRSGLFDPSPEMSLFDLPLRNLPPVDASVNSPAISAKLPSTSPLRPFQPPPESSSGPHTPSPLPPSIPAQEAPQQLADRSPAIQMYSIEIPPQEQLTRDDLTREYNTKENPNDIIKQMPREMWVTAAKHNEMRGSPAPYPGPYPPPLLPASYFHPTYVWPTKPPAKAIRFPSLAKTKQQAKSWYRSWSFRKKNKPVIDPADEVDTSIQNQETTTPTSATKNKGKEPESNTASTQDSNSRYGAPPQPPQSWYRKSAPSSVHTADPRRGLSAESSPGLSQYELLSTPYVGTTSVKSGKEGKRLKEKDSYLSVINEETPTSDRFFTDAMGASSSRMTSSLPRPNFTTGLQQRPSREAMGSNLSPMKRRHPLAIVVPDPDEPLPPPGVAYSQAGPSNMTRKPSQSSQRSTTSIGIEVVPPSGIAPDPVQSPPHTGHNHLSPYHTYRPTSRSSSRVIPIPSITSLISSGGKHQERPPPPAESRSGSRASSRRTDNGGLGPTGPSSQAAASWPQTAMSAAPRDNPMAKKSVEDARSSRSRMHTPMMPLRETQTPRRPESVQSSASKKPPSASNGSTSQTNLGQQQSSSALNLALPVRHSGSRVSLREAGSFGNGFDDGTYLDPAFYPGDKPTAPSNVPSIRSSASRKQPYNASNRSTSQTNLGVGQHPSSSALNLVPPIRHSTSRVSLREAGSFGNGFDEGTYLDPAFYPGDKPTDGPSNLPSRPVSRSTSSVLSYV